MDMDALEAGGGGAGGVGWGGGGGAREVDAKFMKSWAGWGFDWVTAVLKTHAHIERSPPWVQQANPQLRGLCKPAERLCGSGCPIRVA